MPSGYIDDPTTISKEEAWEAIEEKIRATGAGGGKGGKGTAGAKGKSKTATTKKKAAAGVPQGPPPPKRPQSAYLLFCADNRADVSKTTKKLGDISKELARRWKEQGDRGVWERKAEELKKGYEIKKSKWEEENGQYERMIMESFFVADEKSSLKNRRVKAQDMPLVDEGFPQ